jgi:predicted ArsR family transcriptional regulator
MNITSRQKVLEIVRKHPLINVFEISNFLRMTPANVRHHISILRSEGVIEENSSRNNLGRGRPRIIYSVNNAHKKDGLGNLIEGIFGIWASSNSNEEINHKMQMLAYYLALEIGKADFKSINMRLTACVDLLNKFHYQAYWEAGVKGPNIRLGSCPYQRIIKRHPELCIMDKFLLEKLTGLNVMQVSKMECDDRNSNSCNFTGN